MAAVEGQGAEVEGQGEGLQGTEGQEDAERGGVGLDDGHDDRGDADKAPQDLDAAGEGAGGGSGEGIDFEGEQRCGKGEQDENDGEQY